MWSWITKADVVELYRIRMFMNMLLTYQSYSGARIMSQPLLFQ